MIFLFILNSIAISLSFAQPTHKATLSELQTQNERSELVKLNNKEPELVERRTTDGEIYFESSLDGQIIDTDGALLLNQKPVKIDAKGTFSQFIKIDKPETIASFDQVSHDGKIKGQRFQLRVDNLATLLEDARARADRKIFVLTSLGGTYITYNQTNLNAISAYMLSARLGLDRKINLFGARWNIGFFSFINVLPLSGMTSSTAFRFLGVNLRLGRTLFSAGSWSFGIAGGLYYITMVTHGNFGFENLAGPQLYPTFRKTNANGSEWYAYFKYSPVASGFDLLTLGNNELATGLQFRFPEKYGRINYAINLDLSQVSLSLLDTLNNVSTIKSQSISLSGTLSF